MVFSQFQWPLTCVQVLIQEVIQDDMRHHLVQCEKMSSFPKSIAKVLIEKLECWSPFQCLFSVSADRLSMETWPDVIDVVNSFIVIPSNIFENASLIWNCIQCEYLHLRVLQLS